MSEIVMPRKLSMSWEPSANRWKKEFDKKIYRVTCKQLGLPRSQWTQKHSQEPANSWWEQKAQSLGVAKIANHPHAADLHEIRRRMQLAKKRGLPKAIACLQNKFEEIKRLPAHENADIDDIGIRLAGLRAMGIVTSDPLDPITTDVLFGSGSLWAAGTVETVDEGKTLAEWKEAFMDEQKSTQKRGRLTAGRIVVLGSHLNKVIEYFDGIDPLITPSKISPDLIKKYFQEIVKRKCADSTKRDEWACFKQLMRAFTLEDDNFRLPNILAGRQRCFEFQKSQKKAAPFTKAEFQLVFNASDNALKAYLLLMLNCFMTQSDISDLQTQEVDLQKCRICRTRSKKRKKIGNSAMQMHWKLWDITVACLEKVKPDDSNQKNFFLENNQKLVHEHAKGGRTDFIARKFKAVIKTLKRSDALAPDWNKTLKQLRKTGANIIEKSDRHAAALNTLLEHGGSVASKHYTNTGKPKRKLFRATDYLGRIMGLVKQKKLDGKLDGKVGGMGIRPKKVAFYAAKQPPSSFGT